jgi:hypothetical protein
MIKIISEVLILNFLGKNLYLSKHYVYALIIFRRTYFVFCSLPPYYNILNAKSNNNNIIYACSHSEPTRKWQKYTGRGF